MTIPQNVKDAADAADEAAKIASNDSEGVAQWNLIRAHLLSQDAEIERYKVAWTEYNDRTEWVQKTAKPKELGLHRADVLRLRIESAESRLAAANALLQRTQMKDYDAAAWLRLGVEIQAHLSENTHDRA